MNKCVIMIAFLMSVEIAGAALNYDNYQVQTFTPSNGLAMEGVIKNQAGRDLLTWQRDAGPMVFDLIVNKEDNNPVLAQELQGILTVAQDKGEIVAELTKQRNYADSALVSTLVGTALYARNICSNGVSALVSAATVLAFKSFISSKRPNSVEELAFAGAVGAFTYGYNKFIIGEPRGEKETADNA
jgi:hypothetical protein